MPGIDFHFDHPVNEFTGPEHYQHWIENAIREEGKSLLRLSYRFVSDQAMLALNEYHLQHDTLTDILTFPYCYEPIEADIVISVERVIENAMENSQTFLAELRRVMIHGVLHMCGWQDSTTNEQAAMRARETYHLEKWSGPAV